MAIRGSADLVELRHRIAWCRERTTDLAKETEKFVRFSGAYELSTETDTHGETTLFVEQVRPIPPSIAIEGGVILHEMRATLDSLACVLANRNHSDTKDVYFPISKNAAVFADDGKRKIRKLSPTDQAVIAALEPFGGGNAMLFALHEADLLRKHRRLILTGAVMDSLGIGDAVIEQLDFFGGGPVLKGKTIILKYSAATRVMSGRVYMSIALAEPEFVSGKPLIPMLHEFTRLVNSIIDLFD